MAKVFNSDFATMESFPLVTKGGEHATIENSKDKRATGSLATFARPGDRFGILAVFLLLAAGRTLGQEVWNLDTGNPSATEDKLMTVHQIGGSPVVPQSGASLTAVPGQIGADRADGRIDVCDQTSGCGGVFRFNSDGASKTTIYAN